MMKILTTIFYLFLFTSIGAIPSQFINDTIPDVHFAVIRLDYLTYDMKGYYEFSQPYRKSIPEEGYTQAGNVFYLQVLAGDFGYTEIKSRLTGELLVIAETIWNGTGDFLYPPDSLYSTTFEHGYENPSPDTLIGALLFYSTHNQVDSAWSKVKDTDIIRNLAVIDKYEVVIFNHFYSIGMDNPYTAEWFIIAFTHPPAPDDMAFEKMIWPKTFITRNVSTTPEIRAHNFSDIAMDVNIRLTIESDSGAIYESLQEAHMIPADSSRLLFFDPITPTILGSIGIYFEFLNTDGSLWEDAYPENNFWEQQITITKQPVFRPISSIKHPGAIPVRGVALDFDGDGDIDVFQYGYNPKLWQNDGTGNYIDITYQSGVILPHYSGVASATDFNGDNYFDLLISNSTAYLFSGDGEGFFSDITDQSGLSQFSGYYWPVPLDLENDGDKDLIFQSYEQELVGENNGMGYFTEVTAQSGIDDPFQTDHITIGDLNNDGYSDMVFTNWGAQSNVFINQGNGSFYLLDGPWDFIYGRESLLFDYNNDGLQDILFSKSGGFIGSSFLFKNLGDLSFEEVSNQVGVMIPSFHADAADFNGDGYPDLILDHLDSFTLLINEGDIFVDNTDLLVDMMEEFMFGAIGTSPKAQFIDLDGDGDLDIYSKVIVFENQGLDSSWISTLPEKPPIPSQYHLYQNFPNPFNVETTIDFELPQSNWVKLIIYDILGRQIEILVDRNFEGGKHEIIWNGKQYATGIYFYSLKVGKYVETKKLLLLK